MDSYTHRWETRRSSDFSDVVKRWNRLTVERKGRKVVMEPSRLAVWAFLFAHVSKKRTFVWPSVGTISRRLGLAPETVRASLRDLQTVGLISKRGQRRGASGDPGPNEYMMLQVCEKAHKLRSEPEEAPDDAPATAAGASQDTANDTEEVPS